LAGWLFPPEPRHIPGERWANIVLRAAHLVGVAGMASGFLFEIEKAAWLAYWHLTAASGVAMVLLYLACSGWWVAQLKGLSMVLKLIPLWAALHWPVVQTELFLSVVVLSALVAHAPGPVRNWSPLDRWRRRVGFAGDDRNR
jgi:hypothetical protein